MNNSSFHAFTTKSNVRLREIISEIGVSLPFIEDKTTVSFRIPSVKTIDYVKEIDEIKKFKYKNVGRNDLCPCGSKLNFKNCHGK